VKDTRF